MVALLRKGLFTPQQPGILPVQRFLSFFLTMRGHLPFIISWAGPLMRQVSHFYHSAIRMVEIGLYSVRVPPRERQERRKGFWRRPMRREVAPAALLIHYHIFKNAGTSFEWTLQQALGNHLCRYDSPTAVGLISRSQLVGFARSMPRAKAISSHQALLPPPRIRKRRVISSILIRDPIARLRSIYAFERQQEREGLGATKAKELDFKRYVEWRLECSPAMVCNFQVFFCSRREDTPHNEMLTETHLQQAVKNLDQIDIVGTVERYWEWLALAQCVLSKSFPGISLVPVRQNVRAGAPSGSHEAILGDLMKELGSELAEHLLQCNYLDMCLHQVADALLTRGLAEERVGIALVRSYSAASKVLPENSGSPGVR